MMTSLLEKAFTEVSRLSEKEQDALARWLLEELAAQRQWDKSFAESPQPLSALTQEALDEHHSGKTQPLDPEKL